MKLVCLPCAGGTMHLYEDLVKYLNPAIEVLEVEYSGHGTRKNEKPYGTSEEMVQDILRKIDDFINGDEYALLGYSMGCCAVLGVLKEKKDSLPKHVFMAAHCPTNKKCALDDESLKSRIIKLDGIPDEWRDNGLFWRMYLPIYRNDYRILNDFDYSLYRMKYRVPCTVFFSNKDISQQQIRCWEEFFEDSPKYINFSGGHFFIRSHAEEMAVIISNCFIKNQEDINGI